MESYWAFKEYHSGALIVLSTVGLCPCWSLTIGLTCLYGLGDNYLGGEKCCGVAVQGRTPIENWNFNDVALSMFLASLHIAAHTEYSHENVVDQFLKPYVTFGTSTSTDISYGMSFFYYSHCYIFWLYAVTIDVFLASLLMRLFSKKLQFSWDPGVSQDEMEAIRSCNFHGIQMLVDLHRPRTLHSCTYDLLMVISAGVTLHGERSHGPFCKFPFEQHQGAGHVLCNHDVTSQIVDVFGQQIPETLFSPFEKTGVRTLLVSHSKFLVCMRPGIPFNIVTGVSDGNTCLEYVTCMTSRQSNTRVKATKVWWCFQRTNQNFQRNMQRT